MQFNLLLTSILLEPQISVCYNEVISNVLTWIVQMQQHIPMLILVRAEVHIIWIMSTVVDMKLPC